MDNLFIATCVAVGLIGAALGFLLMLATARDEPGSTALPPVASRPLPAIKLAAKPKVLMVVPKPDVPPTPIITTQPTAPMAPAPTRATTHDGACLLGLLLGLFVLGAVANTIKNSQPRDREEDEP
jgi:hypothetical protein